METTIEKTGSEESNQEPSQEQSSADEIFQVIQENAQPRQVTEDAADPESVVVEKSDAEESKLTESEVSTDQDDAVQDSDVAEEVIAGTKEKPVSGKVSEVIEIITRSKTILPGQSVTAEINVPHSFFEVCAQDIMQDRVVWASPEDSLQQAFIKMQQTDAGYIMVGQDEMLEGIISKSDITKAMSPYLLPIFAKWRRPLDDATMNIRIRWIMNRPVRTVKPQTPLGVVMDHMNQFRGRCLPVTNEEGNVLGLVTVFDIFEALLKTGSDTPSKGETSTAQAASTETE